MFAFPVYWSADHYIRIFSMYVERNCGANSQQDVLLCRRQGTILLDYEIKQTGNPFSVKCELTSICIVKALTVRYE